MFFEVYDNKFNKKRVVSGLKMHSGINWVIYFMESLLI